MVCPLCQEKVNEQLEMKKVMENEKTKDRK